MNDINPHNLTKRAIKYSKFIAVSVFDPLYWQLFFSDRMSLISTNFKRKSHPINCSLYHDRAIPTARI
jgi:hypothetical protein